MQDTILADPMLEVLRAGASDPRAEFAELPAALTGGYETSIYAFRLNANSAEWSRPLVIRVFNTNIDPAIVQIEVRAMECARAHGFPVPRVLYSTPQAAELVAPAIVMEQIPGRTMMDELFPRGLPKLIPMLAELQSRLHALDASALPTPGIPSYADQLNRLGGRIAAARLDGLREGLAWLGANAPSPARSVLCHGDFHPLNILVNGGEVTGVIDWSLATIAEPEFDVGNTRILLAYAPIDAGILSGIAGMYQRLVLARRFYSRYRRLRAVDDARVRYYEAYRCLRSLTWSGESARNSASVRPGPWDSPKIARRLVAHFRRVTGVRLSLEV